MTPLGARTRLQHQQGEAPIGAVQLAETLTTAVRVLPAHVVAELLGEALGRLADDTETADRFELLDAFSDGVRYESRTALRREGDLVAGLLDVMGVTVQGDAHLTGLLYGDEDPV